MNMRNATLAAVGAFTILTVSACGTADTADRQVVEKAGKSITVVDNTNESVYKELTLDKIDKIDDLRGMDWVSESQLIVDKENKDLKPVSVEGEQRYPHNLYLHDLSSGSETPLLEDDANLGFAVLSPDKKHVFYKKTEESVGRGFIMDLETKKSVQTGDSLIPVAEGEWTDNSQVIFPNMNGEIVTANVSGQTETAVKTGEFTTFNPVMAGKNIYYIVTKTGKLYAYNTETKKTTTIKDDAIWVIPSPDGQQLAIVKRTGETEMSLTLCDAMGNEKSTLAKGTQVFGTNWSPDGSKLAYTISSPDGTMKGLYVTDVNTGKETPISVDMQYVADKLRWSPSGKKLLTSTSVMTDNQYKFVTYVISFK
jgi:TolB protein